MKFLDRFCCTLTGLTLSAAGLLLLLDPAWTAERLGSGLVGGILTAAALLVAGLGTLCGLRRKGLSIAVLVLISVALIFCLFSGRIRLTGLCLLLLPMAIYHTVFSWREGNGAAPAWFDRLFLGIFALCAMAIASDALVNLPRMEFSPYKVGTDLRRDGLSAEQDSLINSPVPVVSVMRAPHSRAAALLIADGHVVAKTPAARVGSARFRKKMQEDPDRVMAVGILSGRLFAICLAAALAVAASVCRLLRKRYDNQPLTNTD